MKKALLLLLTFSSSLLMAQRYLSPLFSETVTQDVTYGTNIDFLTSRTSDPMQVGADLTALKTAVATGQPIPAAYYNPADTTTDLKVTDLKYDLYEPANDTASNRPLVVYIHTGNFLPPQVNGGINGSKRDSSAIVMCTRLARHGYVAIAPNYRLGWNPLDTSRVQRRAQLLNAVYRAIHDMKELVRVVKADASNLGIDPDRITFMGEGSGGYVALAYSTLDKWAEVEINKFTFPGTNTSYVDSNLVGNIEGLGGPATLTLYQDNGQPTDIAMCINMGGALADISWLEAGDPAMISFHCVRDPFAPFGDGTVIVPTTNEDVVDVSGANVFMKKANNLNNNTYNTRTYNDAITQAAQSRYGQTYSYIYPAPFDTISVNTGVEGLFPVLQPLGNSVFENNGSPWQWWDPNGPIASQTIPGTTPPVTYHQAGLQSNPRMSSQFGRTYQDTILGYSLPRMVEQLNLPLSQQEFDLAGQLSLYPNPAGERIALTSTDPDLDLEFFILMDVSGKTVRSGDLSNQKAWIDLSSLNKGVYMIQVGTSEGTATKRLVKQ